MVAFEPIAPSAERRVAHRHPAVGTVCHITPEGEEKPSTALVWNISPSGVSMLVPNRIKPGSGVHGILETIRGRSPVTVDMHVVHIRQLETGDYVLGAHFDRPLSPAEMKPFVG
jgi:hypothetical protein